jgi:hypothetical protein
LQDRHGFSAHTLTKQEIIFMKFSSPILKRVIKASIKKVSMTEARNSLDLYFDGDVSWKDRIEYEKMKI